MSLLVSTLYRVFKFVANKLNDGNNLYITIAVFTVIVTGLYLDRKNRLSYWKRKNIPSPPVSFFWGNLSDMVKAPALKFKNWIDTYGQVVGIYLGTQPALIVADAAMLREVMISHFSNFSDRRAGSGARMLVSNLISLNGIEWKNDRSVISPTFTSSKMKQMYPLMSDSIKCLDAEFDKIAASGADFDVKLVFSKLTTMVISRCAFATDVDPFNDPKSEILVMLHRFFRISSLRTFMRFFLPNSVKKLVGFSSADPVALDYVAKLCAEILKQRSLGRNNNNQKYKDLLQLLTEVKLEAEKKNKNNGFTETKVISNAILFLIAGFETTSTLLKWIAYALALNPDVQEKLFQQVKQAVDKNGELNYDVIYGLHYLEAVIDESSRLYSPIVRVERIATADHTFANGLKIDKGTSILIPIHAIQQLPRYFPDPQKFRPERFLPPEKENIVQCSHIPFLDGSRNCIGSRFALLETKATLAALCLKYKFVPSEKTPLHDQLLFNHDVNTLEVDNLVLRIERR